MSEKWVYITKTDTKDYREPICYIVKVDIADNGAIVAAGAVKALFESQVVSIVETGEKLDNAMVSISNKKKKFVKGTGKYVVSSYDNRAAIVLFNRHKEDTATKIAWLTANLYRARENWTTDTCAFGNVGINDTGNPALARAMKVVDDKLNGDIEQLTFAEDNSKLATGTNGAQVTSLVGRIDRMITAIKASSIANKVQLNLMSVRFVRKLNRQVSICEEGREALKAPIMAGMNAMDLVPRIVGRWRVEENEELLIEAMSNIALYGNECGSPGIVSYIYNEKDKFASASPITDTLFGSWGDKRYKIKVYSGFGKIAIVCHHYFELEGYSFEAEEAKKEGKKADEIPEVENEVINHKDTLLMLVDTVSNKLVWFGARTLYNNNLANTDINSGLSVLNIRTTNRQTKIKFKETYKDKENYMEYNDNKQNILSINQIFSIMGFGSAEVVRKGTDKDIVKACSKFSTLVLENDEVHNICTTVQTNRVDTDAFHDDIHVTAGRRDVIKYTDIINTINSKCGSTSGLNIVYASTNVDSGQFSEWEKLFARLNKFGSLTWSTGTHIMKILNNRSLSILERAKLALARFEGGEKEKRSDYYRGREVNQYMETWNGMHKLTAGLREYKNLYENTNLDKINICINALAIDGSQLGIENILSMMAIAYGKTAVIGSKTRHIHSVCVYKGKDKLPILKTYSYFGDGVGDDIMVDSSALAVINRLLPRCIRLKDGNVTGIGYDGEPVAIENMRELLLVSMIPII